MKQRFIMHRLAAVALLAAAGFTTIAAAARAETIQDHPSQCRPAPGGLQERRRGRTENRYLRTEEKRSREAISRHRLLFRRRLDQLAAPASSFLIVNTLPHAA